MFAQILLGIGMLIAGVCHFFNITSILGSSVRHTLSGEKLAAYQKGLVFPYLLLGTTFIVMGVVEKNGTLPLPVFLGIYLVVGAVSLAMILANNKKYTGHYRIK